MTRVSFNWSRPVTPGATGLLVLTTRRLLFPTAAVDPTSEGVVQLPDVLLGVGLDGAVQEVEGGPAGREVGRGLRPPPRAAVLVQRLLQRPLPVGLAGRVEPMPVLPAV